MITWKDLHKTKYIYFTDQVIILKYYLFYILLKINFLLLNNGEKVCFLVDNIKKLTSLQFIAKAVVHGGKFVCPSLEWEGHLLNSNLISDH